MRVARSALLIALLHWVLAGVFLYAGATKLGSPQNFADSIASFSILPNSAINLIALTLPPFEILLGLAVITGLYRREALLGLAMLTFVFMIALISAIVRGIPVDCGCFGSGAPSDSDPWVALGRDLLLLVCVGALYLREICRYQTGIPSRTSRLLGALAPAIQRVRTSRGPGHSTGRRPGTGSGMN